MASNGSQAMKNRAVIFVRTPVTSMAVEAIRADAEVKGSRGKITIAPMNTPIVNPKKINAFKGMLVL